MTSGQLKRWALRTEDWRSPTGLAFLCSQLTLAWSIGVLPALAAEVCSYETYSLVVYPTWWKPGVACPLILCLCCSSPPGHPESDGSSQAQIGVVMLAIKVRETYLNPRFGETMANYCAVNITCNRLFLFTWNSNLTRTSFYTRGPGLQWLKLLLRGLSVDSPESSYVPAWSTSWHLCTFCGPIKSGGPRELNSGLFLLSSHAKLPCLPWYGTLGWCQEAVRSFIGVLEFRGSCFCPSPYSSLHGRGGFSFVLTWSPSFEVPTHAWLPQRKAHFPWTRMTSVTCSWRVPSFGSTYVKGRKKEKQKTLSG